MGGVWMKKNSGPSLGNSDATHWDKEEREG